MTIDDIIVEIYGRDPRILEIATLLQAELYGRAVQHRDESGEEAYDAAIRLDLLRADEEETLAAVPQWIAANAESLKQISGEKVLEIQTHFFEGDGSRSLSFDAAWIELLAQASLGLRHQVSRAVRREGS